MAASSAACPDCNIDRCCNDPPNVLLLAVPSLDELPSVIDTLIDAVRNGKIDQQLAEASDQASPRTPKGKREA